MSGKFIKELKTLFMCYGYAEKPLYMRQVIEGFCALDMFVIIKYDAADTYARFKISNWEICSLISLFPTFHKLASPL